MHAGVDADFLVALEIADHPFHEAACVRRDSWLDAGGQFALAPQTLAEFVYVVTDGKRLPCPLTMQVAMESASFWWEAAEVRHVQPDAEAMATFFDWMVRHRLGRKRILDTLLAATLHSLGVRHLVTNNAADFRIFDCFEIMDFRG